MSWARLFASVVATTTGLAFWWALTEPLPVPPAIGLSVAAAILFCAGLIAGRMGVIAAPTALLFSLLVGSIIATQLHQAFRPLMLGAFATLSCDKAGINVEYHDPASTQKLIDRENETVQKLARKLKLGQ